MNTSSRDGRHLRSEQSRQRIIDAMIGLIQEGVLEPTAEQVSVRAGLAIRTVFRHFNEMESLFREITRRMTARAQAIVGGDLAGDSPEATLHTLIDRHSRLYEEMLPMRLAADALRHRSPFLKDDHARFVELARKTLRDVCPSRVVGDRQDFEAVDALLSYEMWLRLRREQKLSPRAAAAVVHRLVDAVLANDAETRP